MPAIDSKIDVKVDTFARNRAHMAALVEKLRALEARTREKSAQAKPLFERRGQLLPRELVARLPDLGAPWLDFSSIAGYHLDSEDVEKSVPGGGMISGLGYVFG